jgi:hypothetical protein
MGALRLVLPELDKSPPTSERGRGGLLNWLRAHLRVRHERRVTHLA